MITTLRVEYYGAKRSANLGGTRHDTATHNDKSFDVRVARIGAVAITSGTGHSAHGRRQTESHRARAEDFRRQTGSHRTLARRRRTQRAPRCEQDPAIGKGSDGRARAQLL